MDVENEILISFDEVSAKEADQLAGDLDQELRREGLASTRLRHDESTQDFGATLVLVLGAPSAIIAARALHGWAVRKNRGRIVIRNRKGDILVEGLESKDIPAVAEALTRSDSKRR